MNNLKTVSPDTGNPIAAFAKITWLYTLAVHPVDPRLYLYLPAPTGLGPDQHVGGDSAGHRSARC